MECATAQKLILHWVDGELSEPELGMVEVHLAECPSCLRHYRMLSVPRRVAQATAAISASPYFYQKLRMRIEEEARKFDSRQLIFGMARRVVPALGGLTLALLSVFAYFQISSTETDIYSSMQRALAGQYQPQRILTFEKGRITNATVLSAIAGRETEREQEN